MLQHRLLQGLAHVQALTADVAEATELLGDEAQTPEKAPAAELLDPLLRDVGEERDRGLHGALRVQHEFRKAVEVAG